MRTFSAVALLLLIFTGITLAQESVKPSPTVVVGQDGRLYINKDLGIYLWISESPNENSQKFRLLSDSSKKHSNPMYFDTEGYNTFRHISAVDTNTKRTAYPERDVIFEVYSDGLPPVSKIIVNGKLSKNRKYYTDSVTVEIKASDAVSGVQKIYCSLAGGSFSEYKGPVYLSVEGDHSIKYYATDLVGNCEEVKTLSVSIKKK